eukprot:11181802-Lingulodinium_polyedra.AAC.1
MQSALVGLVNLVATKCYDSKLQTQFQQWGAEFVQLERAIGEDVSDAVNGLLISSTTGKRHDHL